MSNFETEKKNLLKFLKTFNVFPYSTYYTVSVRRYDCRFVHTKCYDNISRLYVCTNTLYIEIYYFCVPSRWFTSACNQTAILLVCTSCRIRYENCVSIDVCIHQMFTDIMSAFILDDSWKTVTYCNAIDCITDPSMHINDGYENCGDN